MEITSLIIANQLIAINVLAKKKLDITISPRKVSDWLLSLVHRSYNERLPGVGRIRKKCFSPVARFLVQVNWCDVDLTCQDVVPH